MQQPNTIHRPSPTADDQGLTKSAFEVLLEALSRDRQEAAECYELIRKKLIRLFAWRGSNAPEELADQTLNRVALKLDSGLKIESDDPYRYICAVAYRIFQERLRAEARKRKSLQEYGFERTQEASTSDAEEEPSPLEFCFHRCLRKAPTEEQEIILNYYDGEKGIRIQKRRALAFQMGLEINNLRVRAYRIRHRLEQCTRQCVAGYESAGYRHA